MDCGYGIKEMISQKEKAKIRPICDILNCQQKTYRTWFENDKYLFSTCVFHREEILKGILVAFKGKLTENIAGTIPFEVVK